ncbi:MAG: hypothetical protein ACK47B_25205 [Armatimonadota bacterium]
MTGPPPWPCPEARLLNESEPPPPGTHAWLYEGTLERFTGPPARFPIRQRVAWPEPVAWERVRALGEWMVTRLSVNGHLLVGLRARAEEEPPSAAKLVVPEG